jgi:predicted regulator of Ras-like GTPase activity (Roadblock/LC7/MglB family)
VNPVRLELNERECISLLAAISTEIDRVSDGGERVAAHLARLLELSERIASALEP